MSEPLDSITEGSAVVCEPREAPQEIAVDSPFGKQTVKVGGNRIYGVVLGVDLPYIIVKTRSKTHFVSTREYIVSVLNESMKKAIEESKPHTLGLSFTSSFVGSCDDSDD